MDLSIVDAAKRAGVSRTLIYEHISSGVLVARGTPQRLASADVNQFILDRQQATVARIGGDLTGFAESARKRARELGGNRGTHYPSDTDAVAVFGPAAIDAARIPDDARVCRWCWATVTASGHGGIQPGRDRRLYPAFVALLGPPCAEDGRRLVAAWRAELNYGVEAVTEPTQDTSAARTAAAKPKPRTTRYSGNKACGTPVGQWCACHPNSNPKPVTAAGTPKPKAKPPRRAEPHGCGCQCEQHRSQP